MASNPTQLVMELQEMGIPRGPILDAVRYVPRPAFVPPEKRDQAWGNHPLPIGAGQTISQPYTVAHMLHLAEVQSSGRVLEIGGGSGYAAALIAYVVGDMGAVTTMEILPVLAARAAETLRKIGLARVHVIQGDGRHGYPPRSPYDSIIVSAQTDEVPPALIEQLAPGGRLVIPLGTGGTSTMTKFVRGGENLERTRHGPYAFVPLI